VPGATGTVRDGKLLLPDLAFAVLERRSDSDR
jgi:hypothetical protein